MGIAKALAAKNGYELDSNQEVIVGKFYNAVLSTFLKKITDWLSQYCIFWWSHLFIYVIIVIAMWKHCYNSLPWIVVMIYIRNSVWVLTEVDSIYCDCNANYSV